MEKFLNFSRKKESEKSQPLLQQFLCAFQSLIMSLQEKFQAAVNVIRSLPSNGPYQPSNSAKLKFYSLYKQATNGPCSGSKPSFWDPIGRAKFEAWDKLGEMTEEEAMNVYIDELKKIVETMSFSGDVENFLESIAPFYEFISLNSPELDKVKEVVDRLTSSSSGSSGGENTDSSSALSSNNNSLPSSPEKTPEKEANGTIPNQETSHSNSNGHIPNQVETTTHLDVTSENNNLQVSSSSDIIPSAPVHKRFSNGQVKSFEELENEDETLEVQSEVISTRSRHSSEHNSSGSSDEYYSGDSDLDQNDGTDDMTLMKSMLPTIITPSSSSPSSPIKNVDNSLTSSCNIDNNNEETTEQVVGTIVVPKNYGKHSSSTQIEKKKKNDTYYIVRKESGKQVYDTVSVLQGTVDRLNRDVDHVTARLRILEAAYATKNSDSISQNSSTSTNKKIKPFRELSASTWAFIFTWPFAVHFLIKLISWYINRRRRRQIIRPLALK